MQIFSVFFQVAVIDRLVGGVYTWKQQILLIMEMIGMRRILIPVLALFLFTGIFPGICWADTAVPVDAAVSVDAFVQTDTLTVDEAVALALDNRTDIETASLNWDAADVASQIAWETASGSGPSDLIDLIYEADYRADAARTNYESRREAVRFSVYQKYYDAVKAWDDSEAQRLAAKQAEEKLAIAELRFEVGMDTRLNLYQAQQQNAAAVSGYNLAQQTLDHSYITLMEYIGLNKAERPTLVRELTYEPLEITDPEGRIKEIVNDSPSVWLAKKSLTLQELTRENSASLSGKLDDIEHDQAELTIVTTKDSMRQVTRSLYYNVLSMQESYETALQGAKAADEALRVAKLLYEVGMGTKTDVTAAEIVAQSAHQTLDSLSYQHAMLVMAFERPWIAGASM